MWPARSIRIPNTWAETLKRAAEHSGTAFVEIYQNCVIFNPNEWTELSDRKTRDDSTLYLEHGKHMIFGKERDKGIRLNGFTPEVVSLDEANLDEILVHDATSKPLASILGSMEFPDYPAAMGVIRDVRKPDYAAELMAQVQTAQQKRGGGDLNQLYQARRPVDGRGERDHVPLPRFRRDADFRTGRKSTLTRWISRKRSSPSSRTSWFRVRSRRWSRTSPSALTYTALWRAPSAR